MEAAVSSSLGAMGPVLRKLDLLLAPESRLRKRVKDGIGLLKQDLEEVSSALVDLSMLDTPSLRAKCWMEEARELSYHIEDLVDDLMLIRTDAGAKLKSVSSHRVGRVKVALLPAPPRRSTRVAKIAHLRDLLWQASERLERYQLDACCSSPKHMNLITQHRRAPALYGDAANLVGIEASRIKLIEMLTGEAEQQLKVVSIVGPAGVGKTTLAKEIFRELRGQFELQAFVHASRKVDMRRLLGSILSQVQPHHQLPSVAGTVQSLIDSIQEQLRHKRYFIVIDDLWEETAWDIVRGAFPEGNNFSRIVATTENMNVALKCCGYMANNILKMKPLGIQDSGYLFFNRVFGSEQQCPDELKEVSYGIIRKCCGLPLSLIHVAGLLASIDYSELWYHVHDHLCSILNRSHTVEEIQKKILNLSYNSLPHCLKTCLLYFSMYPEGYIMWKVHLVKQWIAESFINAEHGKDTEEIAEGYFEELVNRGMIQPMKIDYNDEVLSCTVHHIIFDVINHNSKEEEFIAAIDYSQPITGLSTKAHRLSFRSSSAKYANQPAVIAMSQLRSIGFFGLLKCMPPIVEFKHLRVLILQFWGNHDGHTSLNLSRIHILFQLRYLKITSDIMVELPEQMQGLHYLETLEIDARVSAVPFDIVHLPSLLLLGLRDATKQLDGIGHIKSLSTLWYFDLGYNSEDNIQSLGQLTNLRHLHLTCSAVLSSNHLKRKLILLVSSLGKLGNLKSLTLTPDALTTSFFFDTSSSISCISIFLQRLELLPPICFFSRLPTRFGELHKLRILKIVVKELQGNDINNIAGLPSLVVFSLYVWTALTGTVIFSTMAFPALKYFKFTCGVMCLSFQAGAMPNLQRLKLCFNAHRGEYHSRVLNGIEHLLNLQEVAGRIGVSPDGDESDRRVVKLSFEDTIRKHPRYPRVDSQSVDFIEEEYHPLHVLPQGQQEGSSGQHEIIERDCAEGTNKDLDSRYGFLFSKSSIMAMCSPVPPLPHRHHNHQNHVADDLPVANRPEPRNGLEVAEVEKPAPVAYLPQVVVLCEQRHQGIDEATAAAAAPSTSGLVSKWRPKDRMKTGCVALVLCLNISVDPPDVIKISPCARMECWIDPFSMVPPKALESIGKTLHSQYERWQPKARYKLQLDPTVEEVKKLCNTCRKYARSERVLFHYNGHGVPKPTSNGEIWVFNKSYTQYIPLPITDLDSWLKTPSIYVFDCSAAGIIVKAFLERLDWSSTSSASSQKDCILLAACEAHQMLPQSAEFPADVFTACLTTPIKMALHWFCKRTLLCGSLDHSLIDQIPGRQNDRKTLLGELNWIFTAITDTIAWNVLPHDLFQRLFRQDLLVASLFRNFLLAERIMRSANCSPVSYPLLPPTHQHHMWDAWDMAAEICLSKLPQLIADPNAEFQPSPFFTEQLMAFEVWLDHGSEDKKPPEQLPIVLQVLLSQSHRFRALVLLGRFLDMGPWAVDLALSVGIFPYVLKLLQTSAMELRQILVFIWTKILSLDKLCQVDLVKDGGHGYFIRFLDSLDAFPEQRAMAAFVIAVIVDGHRTGQEACMNAGLIDVCLSHLQPENPHAQTEPLLLQWLCLCLGKLWEDFPKAQLLGLQTNAPEIVICLLSEPQPEVRAAAVFALGNLLDNTLNGSDDDSDDEEKVKAEINVVRSLLQMSSDGSPLVRSEVAIALTRFASGHNKHLKSVAAEYWKPQSNSLLKSLPSLANISNPSNVYSPNNSIGPVLRVGSDNGAAGRDGRISTSSPIATSSIMHGSPQSDDSSQHSDSGILLRENASNGGLSYARPRPVDNVIYSQFISTMCSVSKDPDPRIASIGRRALSLIDVELVVMKNTRFNSGGPHRGETSSSNYGMARSSSWRDMNSGSSSMKFMTPPVSPPQHDYLIGLRRVCSMEFGQHPINSPDGLADRLLSSASGLSNREPLPQSTIYNWSCGHFSRPLLTVSDDNEETNARREERERIALDYITKCQRSSCKMTSQIASWDTRFDLGTKAALLLPFSPIVVAADENEQIRVWNYSDALPVNSFQNHKLSDRGLSKLLLINELDESLLLAASSDGNVRIWKNFAQKGGQKLVTAFSSVQGHRAAGRSIVIDWQQQSGYLYASGDMSCILVWDLDKEQLLSTIQSTADSAISSLSASQVRSGHFAAGFADGSVRIYDVRSPDRLVYVARPHAPRTEKVVGIGFQPGFDPYKIVSASQAGDIQFLDVRRAAEPYLTIEAHRGSLTALAVHRHAPVVASGSAKQMIKVFSLEGEQLKIIRYQPSFMGQRIGSVNCLSFHPYKSLLAAGASDNALVSIYAEENYK